MKNITLLLLCSLALSGAAHTASAQLNYEPYTFTTFAGFGSRTVEGTGSAARFYGPEGIAVDSAGNRYVADRGNHTIRKITPTGVVTTFAGLALNSGSADGSSSAVRFNQPEGVAADAAGNIYVADSGNHTIRKITPSGVVSTLAGSAGSFGSADGSGSAARFKAPRGVGLDGAGNVYVADTDNSIIRKITPSGTVSTVAGVAQNFGHTDGTGPAARFSVPRGVALDGAGNVYVADSFSHVIRKITPSGDVSTFAGSINQPQSGDGTGSAASFNSPHGVAADSAGNVYVADAVNNKIRKISPSGVVSSLAGFDAGFPGAADGTGTAARFNQPHGVVVDGAGNILVADTNNDTIRRVTSSGTVTTVAGLGPRYGTADGTGTAARFYRPRSVAVDGAGNVYVADRANYAVRKISPSRVVTTLAGLPGTQGSDDGTGTAARFGAINGIAVDGAGNVYVTDRQKVRRITPSGVVSTFAGSGVQGTADGIGTSAEFAEPSGIAIDREGNFYVVDRILTVRKITPSAVVTTLAGVPNSRGSVDGTGSEARFQAPEGVAVDSAGNVYVADTSTIRKITPSGVVTTLAGLAGSIPATIDGIGSAARFQSAYGLGVDNADRVYVADVGNVVRRVTPSGEVTTLAGVPDRGSTAEGTGSFARFNRPEGVAVDGGGKVYVANTDDDMISVGAPAVLITSPLTASAVVGQQFVYQFQTTNATSLAVTSLPPGLTFNTSLSAIVGTPTSEGTFQISLSASNADTTTNATLTLTVQPTPPGPVIVSSTAATVRTGTPFQFQVITSGGSAATRLAASGLPAGLTFDAVTGLISGTSTSEGSTAVTLTVTDGAFTNTSILQLTFTADPTIPVIINSSSASLTPGQAFSYTINAPATSDPSDVTTYTLIGTLPAGLSFDSKTGTISGIFMGNSERVGPPDWKNLSGGIITNVQLFASNSHGTSTLPLNFFLAPTGAVNISTRIAVGDADNVLIAGFIITGNAPKKVVIRAIAPSLKANDSPLPGALQDPTLELHDGTTTLGTNDDWRDSQEEEIIGTAVPPTDDRESAIVATLSPGNYTAIVAGKDNTTGIAVVELYDLGTASLDNASTAQLAQISTRGKVLTDDNVMIGGFIISGSPTKVIARAIGPSLNGIVPGALQDTVLELHDGSGSLVNSNDDWRTTQEKQIIETTVPPTDDRESAIVATLNPGAYTAIVRGKGNTTGVALVEVYGLQGP